MTAGRGRVYNSIIGGVGSHRCTELISDKYIFYGGKMPVINIKIRDKIAIREEDSLPFVVSGNSDYAVVFDFDEEWDVYEIKTARFLMGGGYTDVVFEGRECAIPTLRGGGVLEVGVYAGDIHTTTSAEIGVKPCVTSEGEENASPTPDVYAQIMEKLNSLISGGTGGGSIDGDALREMIEEALSAAKASGEFDGEDGYSPIKGKDYFTEADKDEVATRAASLVNVPVKSVNGKTGEVQLGAADVGARPSTWIPSYSDVGAEKSGTAESKVSAHNTNDSAHNDIRLLISELTARLNALANSTDDDLDQMAEIVAYIKSNKALIDEITTKKSNVSDIVNNLTTNVSNKPLSAAQGVLLKALIDAITVPTKVSELANDKGYLTEHQDISGKADKSGAETWTFTLDDGSTVTKRVVLV